MVARLSTQRDEDLGIIRPSPGPQPLWNGEVLGNGAPDPGQQLTGRRGERPYARIRIRAHSERRTSAWPTPPPRSRHGRRRPTGTGCSPAPGERASTSAPPPP